MTYDRYPLTVLLKSIGLYKKSNALMKNNNLQQVIIEGYRILGFSNYEHVSELDELKALYWDIKDKLQLQEKLSADAQQIETALSEAVQQDEGFQHEIAEQIEGIQEEIHDLIQERNRLQFLEDEINTDAKAQISIYQGLKAQQNHDGDTSDGALMEEIEASLAELKTLKERKDQTMREYEQSLVAISNKEQELLSVKHNQSHDSANTTHSVSKQNRDLAKIKKEISDIGTQLDEDYLRIGQFLYTCRHDKVVRKQIKRKRTLLRQLQSMHTSAKLYQKLAK